MKTEHRDIIERAKLAGFEPSMLAHELLVHDLVNMVLFEVKNIHSPWSKLNEGCQQEVIDRAVKSATEAAHTAINIISSRNVEVVEVKVIDAKFKEKAITITANIDANDPNGGALAKVPGKMCLLVLAPTDYDDGLDYIRPDRDQPDLPLHVSDLTGSLFPAGGAGPDEPDGQHPLGTADELAQRTGGAGDTGADLGKEFGEFTYDDAKQLIVLKSNSKAFKGHWVQSRLAIDSDKTATLLLRLLDDKVVEIETEGESAFDHSFKVIATLDEVV
ncbi:MULTISPECIES: DNA translocase FtsK [Pseudomonas]|uniref:DNA translocase FtsK n=1 Tax=Pseudomonas TaxID=286 RepID=UPI001C65E3A8|nr:MULTISPECIES: DNA translocase FtsK [unclassified Pseudomonas]MBW8127522.1 DNA translocase FtsK [Pseudomonas sp. LAP_36]MBW8139298.1 DNA translocase FtsK [Pseudomonas sp. PAMC 26818]